MRGRRNKMANNQTLERVIKSEVEKILAQPCQYSVYFDEVPVKNGWLLSTQTLEQIPTFGGRLSISESQWPDEEGWMCPYTSSVHIEYENGRVITHINIKQSHYEVVGDCDPIEVTVSQRLKESWEAKK